MSNDRMVTLQGEDAADFYRQLQTDAINGTNNGAVTVSTETYLNVLRVAEDAAEDGRLVVTIAADALNNLRARLGKSPV